MPARNSVIVALLAALLFGASTPLAKLLSNQLPPLLLAAFLYLGSGVGLAAIRTLRDGGLRLPQLTPNDWLWLAAAILSGGIIAPVLLMMGLTHMSAGGASLLLNLEGVFTAVIAWVVFGENADRRVAAGMLLIIAGGAVLAWPTGGSTIASAPGILLIAAACLGWALDNNLTRKLAATDAIFIAGIKGLVAGITNLTLAFALGFAMPAMALAGRAMVLGLVGYGLSLLLFVLALRGLGAARTGAYFSTAPFVGAAVAIGLLHEPASVGFCVAGVLMLMGTWLHLTEHHQHLHAHETLRHTHSHEHDAHHQHSHDFPWDPALSHSHEHVHEPLVHRHLHVPDLHHRHRHGRWQWPTRG